MVIISGQFGVLFREEIKSFCSTNNLTITYRSCVGDEDYYNISGDHDNIDKFIVYTVDLDKKKKEKSIWNKVLVSLKK